MISQVARRKLVHHCLDPYRHAAFCHGIVRHNTGEEEANPMLELAMEYASALGTIIFDKSCRLCNLTAAQVGRNQFTMDVVVDRLDGEVDHASERISMLEGKVVDLEAGYTKLLALGWEQVETSTQVAQGLGQLVMVVLAQQAKIWSMDKRMDAMREMILVLEHTQANPIVVDKEGVMGASLWSASPLSKPSTQTSMVSLSGMVPAGLEPSTGLLSLIGHLGVVSWSMG